MTHIFVGCFQHEILQLIQRVVYSFAASAFYQRFLDLWQ